MTPTMMPAVEAAELLDDAAMERNYDISGDKEKHKKPLIR
jgi:hypothetical protein